MLSLFCNDSFVCFAISPFEPFEGPCVRVFLTTRAPCAFLCPLDDERFLLRIHGETGWEVIIRSFILACPTPCQNPAELLVSCCALGSFTPALTLQTIIHGFMQQVEKHHLTNHCGPTNLHNVTIPLYVFNAMHGRAGGGSISLPVVREIVRQLLKQVKEIHKSKYVHRNINCCTVVVRFAMERAGRSMADCVKVELHGDEIMEDLLKGKTGERRKKQVEVFRAKGSDVQSNDGRNIRGGNVKGKGDNSDGGSENRARNSEGGSVSSVTPVKTLDFDGPRWLRCLSAEIDSYSAAPDTKPLKMTSSAESSYTSELNDNVLMHRLRSADTTTRGFIPPETLRRISQSSSQSVETSSTTLSVSTKEAMAEDVYGIGAVLRHAVTGVPPHLTVDAYIQKLQAKLKLDPTSSSAIKALEGITLLSEVNYTCLKLMRDMLNSNISKRVSVNGALSSGWFEEEKSRNVSTREGSKEKKKKKSILDGGDSAIMIMKPLQGMRGDTVPGYIKDEFNMLMEPKVSSMENEEEEDEEVKELIFGKERNGIIMNGR